ncbi:hypothetical protein [Rubinisphaera italica]|uniref:Uncharacterized protein n=1 Tax=Rubinisphaera italica TaxID=2527969 RepID=A0A5C5XMD4_9PLAN|nr:hypothetical protein [Rubinisphaera italica]TWT64366.1 hypothetical protein Pan54_51280 [Rubinisphaera italica]
MNFTARQNVLFDRIESLIERAAWFPHPIVEIWGGGSLFRLEPSPKDADCVFRFDGVHPLWEWFLPIAKSDFADSILEEARRNGLDDLAEIDRQTIVWWCESFHQAGLRQYSFMDSSLQLPIYLTKRLIKKNYPSISVVELTPRSDPTAWRMTLTKVWSKGTTFDRSALVDSAKALEESDRSNLLQQLAEFRKANRLLRECIQSWDQEKFQLASDYAGKTLPDKLAAVRPSKSTKPTSDIRKMVKRQARLFEALDAAASVRSNDPAVIALEALTSQQKVKRWGPNLVDEGILSERHLGLARHNLRRKHHTRAYLHSRLITDLHDNGCLVQREGEHLWFFTDDLKGLVVGYEYRGWFAAFSHGVFLASINDDREFFDWPVYRNPIRSMDELWPLVEAFRSGEQIENSSRCPELACPFCGERVVTRDRPFDLENRKCSHLVDIQVLSNDAGMGFGDLLDYPKRDELIEINNNFAKGCRVSEQDWQITALFVSSPEYEPPDLSHLVDPVEGAPSPEYIAACDAYLDKLRAS